jgi:hypothetical protein
LSYWIENYTSGVSATFWVKITNNLTSTNQTIYIYYGNSTVTTTSNGTNTFSIWFDDFSTNTLSNYTVDGGNWAVDTTHGWLNQSNTNAGYFQIFPTSVNVANSSLLTRILTPSDSTYDCGTALRAASGGIAEFFQDSGGASVWDIWERTPTETQLNYTTYSGSHASQWHRFRTEMNNNSMFYYWDDNLKVTYAGTFSLTSGSSGLMTYGSTSGEQWAFDYLAVRKFVYPEPSHGAWGSEETVNGWVNDTWTSFASSTPPQWSNITKIVNGTIGVNISWHVYANDTANNWNASEVFGFTTTSSDSTPPQIDFVNPARSTGTTPTSTSQSTILATLHR